MPFIQSSFYYKISFKINFFYNNCIRNASVIAGDSAENLICLM